MTKNYISFLKEHRLIVFFSFLFSLVYPLSMMITGMFATFEYSELIGRIAFSFFMAAIVMMIYIFILIKYLNSKYHLNGTLILLRSIVWFLMVIGFIVFLFILITIFMIAPITVRSGTYPFIYELILLFFLLSVILILPILFSIGLSFVFSKSSLRKTIRVTLSYVYGKALFTIILLIIVAITSTCLISNGGITLAYLLSIILELLN